MDAVPKCNLAAGTRYHSAVIIIVLFIIGKKKDKEQEQKEEQRVNKAPKANLNQTKRRHLPHLPSFLIFIYM